MSEFPVQPVAIIGMAGHFPDAPDLRAFWRNLEQGVESIVEFSDEELLASGLPPEFLQNPNFVRKGTVLENTDLFDANFFGFNPREAEIIDPQQRVLLECAWEAMEDAGYLGEHCADRIGVYAGASINTYAGYSLMRSPRVLESFGFYPLMIAGDKDFLATRISYKLNLRGPSMTVQTACSTSLVAIQVACHAVRTGQCEMALAGGVSLHFPQKMGYVYAKGMIFSPDGHCRPFDAQGQGIRAGDGASIVVLKRLDHALRDGDSIHAIIRGAAVTNDGGAKMGYTAPSIEGQSAVILRALEESGVDPASISYIEAHGTATEVGDPIEITSLDRVFRRFTGKKQYCAIGSVKSNLGHLDVAAGIAGLVKTVLAMKHRRLPPSLHFHEPNPQINFADSPFFVNAQLTDWRSPEGEPLRAGVSSFGIGGTNAHVVLEEPPPQEASVPAWPTQVLFLSARSAAALSASTMRLAERMAETPQPALADVCYTTQVGRKRFPHRRMLVCSNIDEAAAALKREDPARLITRFNEQIAPPVAFLFSGQGSQHAGMAQGLYDIQPVFRREFDRCAELLKAELEADLRELLWSGEGAANLDETRLAQPALFAIEYSLAQMWMSWGVKPDIMIGHSIGEYAAACIAQVFSLEDALRVVAARGRIMQQMPPGAMLAVSLSESELRGRLTPETCIATVNTSSLCAVSGTFEAIAALESNLEAAGVACRRLHTSHAYHSSQMDGALEPFREALEGVRLSEPRLPFISNTTGHPIEAGQATDPGYWVRHLREPVRFAEGVAALAAARGRVFLEVGPAQALTIFAREILRSVKQCEALSSLPHPKDPKTPASYVVETTGRLWLAGVEIDWTRFHEGERLHRVSLPSYPFERQRYFVDPEITLGAVNPGSATGRPNLSPGERLARTLRTNDVSKWFYLPSWRRSALPTLAARPEALDPWICFTDRETLEEEITAALKARGERFVIVRPGLEFSQLEENVYSVDPSSAKDHARLLRGLQSRNFVPKNLLYLWGMRDARAGFHHLILLAQAFGEIAHRTPMDWVIVSRDMHRITGAERTDAFQSLLLGPAKTIPVELPHIYCRSVDLTSGDDPADAITQAILEPAMPRTWRPSAYRGGFRWEQNFDAVRVPASQPSKIRQHGVYLITGGAGGLGLTVAEYLASRYHARLALTGRAEIPPRPEWGEWKQTHPATDRISRAISTIERIEKLGGEVLYVRADAGDIEAMRRAVDQIHSAFGPIQGVVHSAGVVGSGLIELKTPALAESVFAPKVDGTLILEKLLDRDPLDFFVLFSSINAIAAMSGSVDYTSANAFEDAFAESRMRGGAQTLFTSINWQAWQEIGIARDIEALEYLGEARRQKLALGVRNDEGVDVLERVLRLNQPRVTVLSHDLLEYLDATHDLREEMAEAILQAGPAPLQVFVLPQHPRPEISTPHVAPETVTQRKVMAIWEQQLGIAGIGIDDSFFELGGHSLLATSVLTRVRAETGITVPLRAIFEAPTVRLLSALIDTLLWADSPGSSIVDLAEEREEVEL